MRSNHNELGLCIETVIYGRHISPDEFLREEVHMNGRGAQRAAGFSDDLPKGTFHGDDIPAGTFH